MEDSDNNSLNIICNEDEFIDYLKSLNSGECQIDVEQIELNRRKKKE